MNFTKLVTQLKLEPQLKPMNAIFTSGNDFKVIIRSQYYISHAMELRMMAQCFIDAYIIVNGVGRLHYSSNGLPDMPVKLIMDISPI